MRLEVSWMVSRMVFMPSMVRRTASPPLWATSTEWRATSAARSALPDTSSMEPAMPRGGLRGGGDLLGLRAARLGEVLRQRLRLAGGAVELDGRLVDGRHQAAQRIDGVVDGVGDRAGDVLGDGRLHGEIAVGEARELIQQAQDRLLVAFVLLPLRLGRQALVARSCGAAARP